MSHSFGNVASHQKRELVARETRKQGFSPAQVERLALLNTHAYGFLPQRMKAFVHTVRKAAQQKVPGMVPVSVVDGLEAVDIEEEGRETHIFLGRPHKILELEVEPAAIRDRCQLVFESDAFGLEERLVEFIEHIVERGRHQIELIIGVVLDSMVKVAFRDPHAGNLKVLQRLAQAPRNEPRKHWVRQEERRVRWRPCSSTNHAVLRQPLRRRPEG